jgi:hypothetical protein
MNKGSSTLLNSNQLSSTQSMNRHSVLRGSFAPLNMSWFILNSCIQFIFFDILNSTRNFLGLSSSVGQKKGVVHV